MDAVVWRTRSGRIQPLCGLYSRSCLPALRECAQSGNYRLMHFLDQISCTVVDTAEAQIPDFWFYNVNSPEALEMCIRDSVNSYYKAKSALNELLVSEKAWLPNFAEAISILEAGGEPQN